MDFDWNDVIRLEGFDEHEIAIALASMDARLETGLLTIRFSETDSITFNTWGLEGEVGTTFEIA